MMRPSFLTVAVLLGTQFVSAKQPDMSPFKSPDQKYPIKSAEVICEVGADAKRIYVFDNFGDWEYTEDFVYSDKARTQTTVHSLTVRDDRVTIIADVQAGTGTRIRTLEGESVANGGLDMSRQTLFYAFDQNSVTKRKPEVVAGKRCDVYFLKGWGYEGTFWLWQGIPLQAKVNGFSMKTISCREDPPITKASYHLPANIKITDDP